jgi:deoxyhypusine synthase
VTWGKVDKESYKRTTESMQCDYSIVMPFLVKALLDNRARYEREAADSHAQGYLRDRAGYRLFHAREELCRRLTADVQANREWLMESLEYPLLPTLG